MLEAQWLDTYFSVALFCLTVVVFLFCFHPFQEYECLVSPISLVKTREDRFILIVSSNYLIIFISAY